MVLLCQEIQFKKIVFHYDVINPRYDAHFEVVINCAKFDVCRWSSF